MLSYGLRQSFHTQMFRDFYSWKNILLGTMLMKRLNLNLEQQSSFTMGSEHTFGFLSTLSGAASTSHSIYENSLTSSFSFIYIWTAGLDYKLFIISLANLLLYIQWSCLQAQKMEAWYWSYAILPSNILHKPQFFSCPLLCEGGSHLETSNPNYLLHTLSQLTCTARYMLKAYCTSN